MSANDETLIEALRTAGHDQAANALRDKSLAGQLRDAGHEALAAQLDGQPEPAEPPTPSPAENATADAEAFVQELKDKNEAGWTTSPRGLLEN